MPGGYGRKDAWRLREKGFLAATVERMPGGYGRKDAWRLPPYPIINNNQQVAKGNHYEGSAILELSGHYEGSAILDGSAILELSGHYEGSAILELSGFKSMVALNL